MNLKDVIHVVKDFLDENWSAFDQRCQESGLDSEEVDTAIDDFKNGNYAAYETYDKNGKIERH